MKQSSEFGKKTDSKKMGKIRHYVLGLGWQNLIGFIGQTSVRFTTYKQERYSRRKYVIYSIFKNQMYDLMNVL